MLYTGLLACFDLRISRFNFKWKTTSHKEQIFIYKGEQLDKNQKMLIKQMAFNLFFLCTSFHHSGIQLDNMRLLTQSDIPVFLYICLIKWQYKVVSTIGT